jgi:deoxyribodipyrimidine photo-lyase
MALAQADQVISVFVLDPVLMNAPYVGPKRLAFMLDGVRALDDALCARGNRLIVRRGPPLAALTHLVNETDAEAIFAEADVSPYARKRDARVATQLPLYLTEGLTVFPQDAVHKRDGGPYQVYTPYRRTWKRQPMPMATEILSPPEMIPGSGTLSGLAIPNTPKLPDSVPFKAGEDEAARRLRTFKHDAIAHYATTRDRVDLDGTSQLSPYLRFGMISARQAVVAALEAREAAATAASRESADTWLNELIWREFYLAILYHFPQVRRRSFRENLRGIQWRNDDTAFAAWCAGHTGYPIVDAAMHQLHTTGWMHNRARMIVASFLTKDLLIDWRWGERHFMQHLIDGDPAANNGGWQWSAGTGTDAAPYFRIFNPTRQSETCDPQGVYIRRWVPALADVPDAYIYEPWNMPEETQRTVGCMIGQDYPPPIVKHKPARGRALAAYRAARANAIASKP